MAKDDRMGLKYRPGQNCGDEGEVITSCLRANWWSRMPEGDRSGACPEPDPPCTTVSPCGHCKRWGMAKPFDGIMASLVEEQLVIETTARPEEPPF